MRRACIDIGSNTTRLLVSEYDGEQLLEVHQERVFTRLGRGLDADGRISPAKLEEVVAAVTAQAEGATALGCVEIHAVATAAVRRAANGGELVARIEAACGVETRILTGDEEARFAFLGATGTLDEEPEGELGVVDVGGGSSELIVGTTAGGIEWCRSFAVGSGDLAHDMLRSERPSAAELDRARRHVAEIIGSGGQPPPVAQAVAVGGSATSLRRLAGPRLDDGAFRRVFELLRTEPTMALARRYALDRERIRLLPAALIILEASARMFGVPLLIGRGGLREGVLLEAAALAAS